MNFEVKGAKKSGALFSLFICFYLLSAVVFSVVALIVKDGFIKNLLSPLCYTLAFFCVFLFNNKIFEGKSRLVPKERGQVKFYILALLLSVGMFFFMGGLNGLFLDFLERIGLSPSVVELDLSSPIKLLLSIMAFAVLPAVFEELFFRNILIENLKGNRYIISIIVGLLFAVYHLSLSQFLYQFIYGALLTLLALKGKSVYPSMLAHFINNFAVLLLEYFKINLNFYAWYTLLIGGISLAIFIATIIFTKEETREKEGVKDFILFSLVGVAPCVLLIISGVI